MICDTETTDCSWSRATDQWYWDSAPECSDFSKTEITQICQNEYGQYVPGDECNGDVLDECAGGSQSQIVGDRCIVCNWEEDPSQPGIWGQHCSFDCGSGDYNLEVLRQGYNCDCECYGEDYVKETRGPGYKVEQ
jgi:hypothetical protein